MNTVLIPPVLAPFLPPVGPMAHAEGRTMGTTWSVAAYGLDADAIHRTTEAVCGEVIAEMSSWADNAAIVRFNRAAPGIWFDLPPHFSKVLAEALRIAALTGGAFDPACGGLVDLWGFGPAPFQGDPDADDVARAASVSDWRTLEIEGGRLRQPGGLKLDLSGIAKGFAVDLLAERLAAAGAISALVEIGGELKGFGAKRDGQPWWVDLEAPAPGAERTLLALHGCAVATSGDYRRWRAGQGRRLSHTIDPATGAPVGEDAPASVTVIHASCMTADAWATALTVLGLERGLETAARHGLAARFLIRRGEAFECHASAAFAAMDDAALAS